MPQRDEVIRVGPLEITPGGHRFVHTHVGFGPRFAHERSHAFHNPLTNAEHAVGQ